jgi:hypothetical protein
MDGNISEIIQTLNNINHSLSGKPIYLDWGFWNVIILLLTFIALIYYAWQTKRIAEISEKEFKLNNRPFVFVSDFFVDNNPPALRLFLGNSGKLPAEIKLKTANIGFYSIPSSSDSTNKLEPLIIMRKRTYYVFPNQKNSAISYPLDQSLILKMTETDGFILYVQLEYWQIGIAADKKKLTDMVINFRTNKGTSGGNIHDIQTIVAK